MKAILNLSFNLLKSNYNLKNLRIINYGKQKRYIAGKVMMPSTQLVKTMLNYDGLFLMLFHAK